MPRAFLAKSLLETCAIQNILKFIEETFLLSEKTKFCFPNDVSKCKNIILVQRLSNIVTNNYIYSHLHS